MKTISPASGLPTIREELTINGYTQTGASPNTLAEGNDAVLKVQLNGTNAGADTSGLRIEAADCVIEGLAINRFVGTGILIFGPDAKRVKIQGNFVGTNAAGTTDLGNTTSGVRIFNAPDNTVGGTTSGQRNLISGNDNDGISIGGSAASSNSVQGNHIGTNADGDAALGNGADGVFVSGPENIVGGTSVGARNLISGNNEAGVRFFGTTSTGNTVLGNFIGTESSGLGDLGNGQAGVEISIGADDNLVGDTAAGARNVISGNGGDGVLISNSQTAENAVRGNFIGTNASGNATLGNSGEGVEISNADENVIGGTVSGARNVISGNGGDGVVIFGSDASGNRVQGNFIGTNAAGNAALGNDDGVVISSGSGSTIGSAIGSTAGGNRIAHNDQDGVLVFGGLAVGNSVLSNSIFSNGELGIDLAGGTEDAFGVTANDTDDPDAPSSNNHRQNFPVISSAIRRSTPPLLTTITGTLNSNPNQTYTVQCFVAAPDPSTHGEGQIPAGVDTTVTTNANGDASFACVSPVPQPSQAVTTTATNTSGTASGTTIGDTSEFSKNEPVVPGP